jgi:hypothetical protein
MSDSDAAWTRPGVRQAIRTATGFLMALLLLRFAICIYGAIFYEDAFVKKRETAMRLFIGWLNKLGVIGRTRRRQHVQLTPTPTQREVRYDNRLKPDIFG